MKKKPEILNRANNPKYIPGIYNYCDRWCERCTFTDRCLNFDENQRRFSQAKNENFLEAVQKTFEETRELLEYIIEKKGTDPEELQTDKEMEQRFEKRSEKARNNELTQTAKEYSEKMSRWIKDNKQLITEKEKKLQSKLELGIKEKEMQNIAMELADAFKVLRWYQYQIYVKLMRALTHDKDIFDFEDSEEFPSDADGSAKVALLGITRSLAAWGNLYKHLPEKEDEILYFLALLEILRKKTEAEFPKAWDFVRPGFDE
jgi:hypothetical protein